ncbi:TPA: hypothetical protein ACGPAL_001288 [Streptococcus suis]
MNREELLDKCYLIRKGLYHIYDLEVECINLSNQKRNATLRQESLIELLESKEETTGMEKVYRLAYMVFLSLLFTTVSKFLFLGIGFVSTMLDIVFSCIGFWILSKHMRRHKESWLSTVFYFLLFGAVFVPVLNIIETNFFQKWVLIIPMILAIFVGKSTYSTWIRFVNALIEQENSKVEAQNAQGKQAYNMIIANNKSINQRVAMLQSEMNETARALYTFGDGWYPKDYYFLDAIEFFIHSLENFMANTVQEMILLYRNHVSVEQTLAYQRESNELQKANIINQERMQELLQYNNYLVEQQVELLEKIDINTSVQHLQGITIQHNHYH